MSYCWKEDEYRSYLKTIFIRIVIKVSILEAVSSTMRLISFKTKKII
ncbi:MAG: hypothetical protein ACFNVV_03560 [Bacteroidota bacterium]